MKKYRLNIKALFDGGDSRVIREFVNCFSEAIYPGKGAHPVLLKKLDIDAVFPLRCLVGIPEDKFTREKQLLVQAYCKHLLGVDVQNLWTNEGEWQPTNPARRDAPLERCIFDMDWALSLGLVKARWEQDVLMVQSSAAPRMASSNPGLALGRNTRFLLALAVFGFFDPMQFFSAEKSLR